MISAEQHLDPERRQLDGELAPLGVVAGIDGRHPGAVAGEHPRGGRSGHAEPGDDHPLPGELRARSGRLRGHPGSHST